MKRIPTEQEIRERYQPFIADNWIPFAATAWRLYRKEGPGMLCFLDDELQDTLKANAESVYFQYDAQYFPLLALEGDMEAREAWGEDTVKTLREYDPSKSIVVAVLVEEMGKIVYIVEHEPLPPAAFAEWNAQNN